MLNHSPANLRRLVLGVYRGRQWALIEEHLHDVLGRQAREAGDAAGAAQHFMAMLACPHNSPHCQRLYLAQFTEVLQAAQAQLVSAVKGLARAALALLSSWHQLRVAARRQAGAHGCLHACCVSTLVHEDFHLSWSASLLCPHPSMQGFPLVLSLPLPAVNCEHVGVQHDGQAAYSGVEARHLAPEAWQALEAALQPGLEGHPSGTWLDGERWMRAGRWLRLQGGVHTHQRCGDIKWCLVMQPLCPSCPCWHVRVKPLRGPTLPALPAHLAGPAGGSRAARLNEAGEEGVPRSCCVGEAVGTGGYRFVGDLC